MIELPMQHNGIINMNEISDTKNGVCFMLSKGLDVL